MYKTNSCKVNNLLILLFVLVTVLLDNCLRIVPADEILDMLENSVILLNSQLSEYKTITLRCTFIEEYHGYINPCQDVINDILPEYKGLEDTSSKQAKPVQFYPTNPYDPTAGICNILLKITIFQLNVTKINTYCPEIQLLYSFYFEEYILWKPFAIIKYQDIKKYNEINTKMEMINDLLILHLNKSIKPKNEDGCHSANEDLDNEPSKKSHSMTQIKNM